MFSIGDNVIYPGTGVCTVEDIKKQKFSGMEAREYYFLKPVYDSKGENYFVPVEGGKVRLRKLLTKEEIDMHIKEAAQSPDLWISDDRKRQEVFLGYIKEEDSVGILKSIAALYEEKSRRENANKKLRLADERILNEGMKLLHREFAFTLGITLDEVEKYIGERWKIFSKSDK